MTDAKNKEQILISVIIPIYNVEKYLEKCLVSVTNQTYRNLDIILVDDGSPDGSPKLCDEWAQKDHRIQVIHKENGGLSDARNAGLRYAKGEYVAFVDSDDWIDVHMLENMLNAMLKHKADLVICQFFCVYPDGSIKRHYEEDGEEEILGQKQFFELLLDETKVTSHAWRKIYKREHIPDNVFPRGKNYEDLYSMPDIIRSCQKIVYLSDAYYFYRMNENGIVNNPNIKNYMDLYDAIVVSGEKINRICPSLKDKVKTAGINKKLMLWITCFQSNQKDHRVRQLKEQLRNDLRKVSFCQIKGAKKKGLLFLIKYLPAADRILYCLWKGIK